MPDTIPEGVATDALVDRCAQPSPRRLRETLRVDEGYELFLDLDADEHQIEFPIVYTSAKAGLMLRSALGSTSYRAWVAITPAQHYERAVKGYSNIPYGANNAQGNGGLLVNADLISNNYTLPSGFNALSVGPITVASGVTVTVTSGQNWVTI